MKSHMMKNLHLPSKQEEFVVFNPRARRRGGEEESASSPPASVFSPPASSPSSSDLEFAVDTGSVILQDRESETESLKNLTHLGSNRKRKIVGINRYFNEKRIRNCTDFDEEEGLGKVRRRKLRHSELWAESEPVSSMEDAAFCLMMLSRDNRPKRQVKSEKEEEEEEESMAEIESEKLKFPKIQNPWKYKCETCRKAFRSYQALGGHRASHKKMKLSSALMADKRIHECRVCFRVFSSGQALGGHKRSHFTGSSPLISSKPSTTKLNLNLIDLNLPAPIDEDSELVKSSFLQFSMQDSSKVKTVKI